MSLNAHTKQLLYDTSAFPGPGTDYKPMWNKETINESIDVMTSLLSDRIRVRIRNQKKGKPYLIFFVYDFVKFFCSIFFCRCSISKENLL